MHTPNRHALVPTAKRVAWYSLCLCLGVFLARPALAETHIDSLNAEDIMRRVDQRYTGNDAEWDMVIILRNSNGEERRRESKLFRKEFKVKGKRQTRQVVVFNAPRNIRNVGMLSFDYKDEALEDDMWLYLPALRKIRRIPASRRGDNFVGTDLTFEDVKQGFAVDDYRYQMLGETQWEDEGHRFPVYRIRATPKTASLKDALGFDHSELLVRKDIFAMVKQTFYDANDKVLRINQALNFKNIQGIWTAMELNSRDLGTNHFTALHIQEAVYNQDLQDGFFHERTLVSERIR